MSAAESQGSQPKLHADVAPLMRLPMVMRWTGLGRSTIYRLVAEHKFPAPIVLATRAVAWRRADLENWSESRPHASH